MMQLEDVSQSIISYLFTNKRMFKKSLARLYCILFEYIFTLGYIHLHISRKVYYFFIWTTYAISAYNMIALYKYI